MVILISLPQCAISLYMFGLSYIPNCVNKIGKHVYVMVLIWNGKQVGFQWMLCILDAEISIPVMNIQDVFGAHNH